MKHASIYAIGIGPGDPELLTIKALRILNDAQVLCVPRGKEEGTSLALEIIKAAHVDLTGKKLIEAHFPMKRGSQKEALRPTAMEIIKEAASGQTVAFITLGDPTLYSTWFHLQEALQEEAGADRLLVQIVPGVSSVHAAAAAAGISLALSGQRVAIVPAVYMEENLDSVLKEFDTVVLMKAQSKIEKIKAMLASKGLADSSVFVSGVGMEGQIIKPVSKVGPEEGTYFSTVIVRRPHV